jgi:UDP-N-acetylmuramate dehydrogenase
MALALPETRRERATMVDEALVAELRKIARVKRDEPLARHTTFGIGGPADVFVTVSSAEELRDTIVVCRRAGTPHFVLGAGSNILVGDAGIRGVVIDNEARQVSAPFERDGELIVRVESGASFAALARNLAREGYSGIEWAAGIPGTLGGAVVYNAGAYGSELADVLRTVTILDASGATRDVPTAALRLAYRSSAFNRGELPGCVVLAVQIAVTRGDPAALAARIAELDGERLAAQPRGRNSGSTFRNPLSRHAWELIDAVGLRGHRIGDAQFSEKHCNFIENRGRARAADVAALMREARQRVRERFGIELVDEVELVGEGF